MHRPHGLLIAICLASATPAIAGQVSDEARPPAVDHHMHLVSPTAAATLVPPLLPEVDVPPAIQNVLLDRVRLAKDPERFSALFEQPPLVLHALFPTWLQGEEALETAEQIPDDVTLVPHSYRPTEGAAFVAGTWMYRASSGQMRPMTNFFMHLVKSTDGRWKISAEGITANAPPMPQPVDAARLLRELDAAGIRMGVALSLAYQHEDPRAENEWVAAQAKESGGRLVPICGINPLADSAIAELSRCAQEGVPGIKLHLGNARFDFDDPAHLAKLKNVFQAADEARLAVIIHLHNGTGGADSAERFVQEVLPLVESVPVQIAHMGGAGPGLDADDALGVLVDAIKRGAPGTANLWMDAASTVTSESSEAELARIAERFREVGLGRILFGSDRSSQNEAPVDAWKAFRRLPLSDQEFARIAGNQAPYLRQ